MADKKTKQIPEAKTLDQLNVELIANRADLIEARRGNAAGELANPRVITETRKKIARLKTAINQANHSDDKETK